MLDRADAEERTEFAEPAAGLQDSQLERLRNAAVLAEKTAPARPHGGESAHANMLVGPFAAMLNRARDAISGKG